jgi:hypothetical protein
MNLQRDLTSVALASLAIAFLQTVASLAGLLLGAAGLYGSRAPGGRVNRPNHGSPSDKIVNRGLLAIAQRLELGVVATNAVRFATPEDALAHTVLGAMRGGRRADGLLSQSGVGGDLPMLALDAIRAQGI